MRSSWKFVYVTPNLFRKIFKKKLKLSKHIEDKKPVPIWNKRSFIPSFCSEGWFRIYSGKRFVWKRIKRNLIGSFIGQFILTKKITCKIHGDADKLKKSKVLKVVLKTDSYETIKKLDLVSLLSAEEKKAFEDKYGPFNKSN